MSYILIMTKENKSIPTPTIVDWYDKKIKLCCKPIPNQQNDTSSFLASFDHEQKQEQSLSFCHDCVDSSSVYKDIDCDNDNSGGYSCMLYKFWAKHFPKYAGPNNEIYVGNKSRAKLFAYLIVVTVFLYYAIIILL